MIIERKFMRPFQIITVLLFLTYSNLVLSKTNDVGLNKNRHPVVNLSLPQYIVGYGSLMQSEAKKKTYPEAGPNIPVIVHGYQRGWFQKGAPIGFSATFLGVIRHKSSQFNGVIFNLPPSALYLYDKREMGYYREELSLKQLRMLSQRTIPRGQFWIYVPMPEKIASPSARYPIVQSYVDIFLSGCLEIQRTYHLKNFAKSCVDTTHDWSSAWVNDRIFPRRPFVYQPDAMQIDQILSEKMPEIFKQIKIE